MNPSTCSAQKKPGGQQEEEHGIVHHFKENIIKEGF